MAKQTVELEILPILERAERAIKDFSKNTQEQLDSLNVKTAVSAINDGFTLLDRTVGKVFRTISNFMDGAIAEAAEAEKANIQLANSMRIVGDFSEEAFKSLQAFSEELARSTSLSDDQVTAGLALAKSYKLTNDEAQKVLRVAADLSALTGDSLTSSIEKLAKSYNGFTDKSLKQLIPELKNLTAEQLASGAALDLVAKRADGSAAALTDSFGGSLGQVSKGFKEVLESIGNFIVQNEEIKDGLKVTAELLFKMAEAVTEMAPAFNATTKAIRVFFSVFDLNQLKNFAEATAPSLSAAIKLMGFAFGDAKKDIADTRTEFEKLNEAFKDGARKANATAIANQATVAARLKVIQEEKTAEKIKKVNEDLANSISNIRVEAESAGLDEIGRLTVEYGKKFATIESARSKGILKGAEAAELVNKILLDFEQKRLKITLENIDKEKKARIEAARKAGENIERIIGNPGGAALKFLSKGETPTKDEGIALAASFTNTVLKGADGARKLVADTLGAVANMLVDKLGPVVSEIVNVLAQGPEKTREMVEGFARAIPAIIKNLADSLPVLIETLVRELPPALAAAMPTVAVGFSTALIKNIPNIVKGFADAFLEIPQKFVDALIDAIPGVGGILGGGDGGGIGGVIGDVGDFIGDLWPFANGGRVPNIPAFEGDRFPARLNAGEQVLSQDLSNKLESFLEGGGAQSGPVVVQLVVGQQELARAILNLNRGGFRTA